MVARSLSIHLRPNSAEEFTRIIENEVIPMIRGLKGFQDKIVLVTSGGLEAIGLSFWDQREDAEAYGRGRFRKVMKALAKVVEGTPSVETREVSNSTFHKIPGHVAACRPVVCT